MTHHVSERYLYYYYVVLPWHSCQFTHSRFTLPSLELPQVDISLGLLPLGYIYLVLYRSICAGYVLDLQYATISQP